jgi:hypothetical protein
MVDAAHRKIGWILIGIGILFVLRYILDWGFYWAAVLLVIGGVILAYALFSKAHGGVFAGTLLFLLGLFFLLRETDVLMDPMSDLWPIILIIVGVSFTMVFLFRPQEWGMLIPGGILLVIGVVILLWNYRYISRYTMSGIFNWWPLILIAIGAWLLLGRRKA